MILFYILTTFSFSFIFTYNLDFKYPLIYTDPAKNNFDRNPQNKNNYFGFSVLLIPEYENFESQLIVGAPRANYSNKKKLVKEPGIAYQCSLFGKCLAISPITDLPPDISMMQIPGMYAKLIQDNGWFGMSVASIHPTLLKICAPHTKLHLFKPFTDQYFETMQGICYFYSKSPNNSFLQLEIDSLTTYNFSSIHWYDPQHGFSQNVAVGISPLLKLNIQEKSESIIKSSLKNTSIIVGNPTHQGTGSTNIIQTSKHKTLEISNDGYEQAEFGFSLTSGCYFKKNEILFASGAPAWKFMGKVAIINSSTVDPVIITFLNGHDLGEYFGASLVSGDLNNDGFDDLIVGAPHYGDDKGKVYIYLGSENGFLEYHPVLEGTVPGAQFGYSLSCGDLDLDGFADLIVGAPWEQFGAIYIYNGYSNLHERNILEVSQKILAIEISIELRGFGFSISNLADIDNNKFLDVAVGAYKSSHVVILRAKPVEKIQLDFRIQPTLLKRNTQRISPEFCLKSYKTVNSEIIKNYTFMIVIDSKCKRFTYDYIVWNVPITEKTYQVFQYHYSSQKKSSRLTNPHWNGCSTSHFNVKADTHNFYDPVDVTLTYELNSYQTKELNKNDTYSNNFCKLCPIKYVGRESKTFTLSVPYETSCEQNNICDSDISVTTSIYGVGKNYTWEIGSGDINVELKLQNHGEPAYFVNAVFFIPEGIHLRSILSFCQEEVSQNLIVTCQVGNPFNKGEQKIIKLDLDMKYYESNSFVNFDKHKLFINVTIKSQTRNQGTKQISIPLILQSNISSSLTVKSLRNSYYLVSNEQKNTNITFQHVYNIIKHGATSITKGLIKIEVPTRINDNEPFIFIQKPQFQHLDSVYDCIFTDVLPQSQTSIKDIFLKKKYQDTSDVMNLLKFTNSTQNIQNNTIFFDCLNNIIHCKTIICNLTSLKLSEDVGTIVLNMTIKLELLKKMFNTGTIIQFHTRGQVTILNPLKHIAVIQASTTFYNLKNIIETKHNIWIILISMIIGLIILAIITSTLYYIGFFERKQKLKISWLKVSKNKEIQDQDAMEELNNEVSNGIENFSEVF